MVDFSFSVLSNIPVGILFMYSISSYKFICWVKRYMDFSLLRILPGICPVLTPELQFVFPHNLSDTKYYQILIFANLMGENGISHWFCLDFLNQGLFRLFCMLAAWYILIYMTSSKF